MRGRHALVLAGGAFVAFGIACVDLFHGTDFETLCTRSPDDPQCGGDAATLPDVGVEAAVDARRPHPDFCAWTSAEARVQALRACAWLGACEGPLGESAFGPCAVHAQLAYDCVANPSLRPRGETDELWSCLATVKTCGDVDQCVFPAGVEPCRAVSTGSFTACGNKGNSGVRVRCANPLEGRAAGVEPCAMLAKTCSKEDESAASCSGAAGFACTTTNCSGTAAVDCNPAGTRTFDRGIDCAKVGGGTCETSDAGLGPRCAANAGAATCVDQLPACDGNSAKTIVTSCVSGSNIRVDCDALGLPCDDSQPVLPYDPAAACVRRTSADLCTAADACVGTRLQSCGRGALQEVDCASVGLGTCTIVDGRAACTPR